MSFMRDFLVTPAYGRVYLSLEEVLEDWNKGKDFRCDFDGPYMSIRDSELLKSQGYKTIVLVGYGTIANL